MSRLKISNRSARECVEKNIEFDANNIFARWIDNGRRYAVYSYGFHWPMYVFEQGQWFGNEDKRSVTTSKHATQTRPLNANVMFVDLDFIVQIAREGFAMALHQRSESRFPV